MNIDELKLYLPKYLSDDSEKALVEDIRDFPRIPSDRFYTEAVADSNLIYQGDGIRDLLIVNLPTTEVKRKSSMILSNTCDIDPSNLKLFSSRIVYSPIINLEDYIEVLRSEKTQENRIFGHLSSIRNQELSQIFYLPAYPGRLPESLVFLDRLFNLPSDFVPRNSLQKQRLFTLSNTGIYLFVFKLSIHFTRIQESIDRCSTA